MKLYTASKHPLSCG